MGFDRPGDSQHSPTRLLVDGETAYGVTPPVPDAPNELVAYDLTTGAKQWSVPMDDARALQPLAVDDGTLVVAGGPVGGAGPMHLIKVDTGDGAVRSDEEFELDGGAPLVADFRFFWADDRVYGIRGRSNVAGVDVLAYGG